MTKELVTFDKHMDGYMEPCEGSDWVRHEDAMERIAELEAENEKSLKGLGVLLNNWNRDVENLEAENEKFRAALTEIADHEPDCDCKKYQFVPCLSCTAKGALGRGMWAEKSEQE